MLSYSKHFLISDMTKVIPKIKMFYIILFNLKAVNNIKSNILMIDVKKIRLFSRIALYMKSYIF